jgi:hypothetical protein
MPGISNGTVDSSLNKNGLNQEIIEFGTQKSSNLQVQSAIGSTSLVSGNGDWEWELSFCAFDRRLHVCSVGIVVGNFEKGSVISTKDKYFIGISSRHGYLRNGKIISAAMFGPGDHIRLSYESSKQSLSISVNGVFGRAFDTIISSKGQDVFPVARTNRPSCELVVLDCFSNMSASHRNPDNHVFPAVESVVSSFAQTLNIAKVVTLAITTEQYIEGVNPSTQPQSCKFDPELTMRFDRGFTFREDNTDVSFPCGPVICFSDLVCGPSNPSQIVYLSFKCTGSNDAWSVGVVPEAKTDDKNYLWQRSEAVGRYNSGSGCALTQLRMPSNEAITMCIDATQHVWTLYFNGQEVCRQDIPLDQFPCRLALNGHSGCRFQLLPDQPIPESISVPRHSAAVSKTKWLDSNADGLYTEQSAQLLLLRMIHKCCVDAVLAHLVASAKSDSFDGHHSIVPPLFALDGPTRDICIEFVLKIISVHHPKGLSGAFFIEHLASQLFEGREQVLSPLAASVSSRLCVVAASGAFSTSRKALDVLNRIVSPVVAKSSSFPGIYKCCIPLWCINSLAPEKAACFKVCFGGAIGQHLGIMLDAGWANVVFGGRNFQIPISCAIVLSIIMHPDRHSEAFEVLFLQQQTQLPAATVRNACELLVDLGLIEFLQERQAVRLVLKSIPKHGQVKRIHSPRRTPFTTHYLRLVQYLFECFKSKPCLDEVLFTSEAIADLDVDAGSIGHFLCDLERKELILRTRGYLHPLSTSSTLASSPPSASLLQTAIDDLCIFERLPSSVKSWLSSLVLFIPDHSIKSPHPWTSAVTSGFTEASMDAFCRQVAPLLVDICKQSSHDSLDVSNVFLRRQGCIASTIIETLANHSSPKSLSVACKSKEGFCLVCLEEATLHTPCDSSNDACWACADCWARNVETVRKHYLCYFRHVG